MKKENLRDKQTLSRRLEDVIRLCLQETSSRLLDQGKYIHLTQMFSEDFFKTLWSKPIYSSWSYVFKTSSRRLAKAPSRHLQDVFKTSLRHLQGFLLRRLQDVFKRKTSLRYLQNAFKTFWRRLQDLLNTSSRHLEWCLQEVFKTYYKVFFFFSIRVFFRGHCWLTGQ